MAGMAQGTRRKESEYRSLGNPPAICRGQLSGLKEPFASLSNLFSLCGQESEAQAITGTSRERQVGWSDKAAPVSQSLEVLKLLFLLTPKGFQATNLPVL